MNPTPDDARSSLVQLSRPLVRYTFAGAPLAGGRQAAPAGTDDRCRPMGWQYRCARRQVIVLAAIAFC